MKLKEWFKKLNKKGKIMSISIIFIIVIGIIIFPFVYNPSHKADTTLLIPILQKSSELTTAKLRYTGMTEFKDSGIKILNRSDYIMVYEATARIGIDVDNIDITANDVNKKIIIKIPKAKVQDVKVKSDSIKYFDEGFALFNVDQKDDANKGTKLAEKEAEKEAENIGILDMANKQAEALIKGLLSEAIPKGYEIEFR